MTVERTIVTRTHGRYLVDVAGGVGPHPLLVGFHGYAEQATIQLERLRKVRGENALSVVSIQGLHRFYRSGGEDIAASWMTREDRALAIADNITYVDAVLDEIAKDGTAVASIFFTGFSQGASMAYRAATLCARRPAGVMAIGGDIPPELTSESLARIPRVLLGWNVRDPFFGREKLDADERRLREAGVNVSVVEIDADHRWTDAFTRHASEFLQSVG